MIIRRFFSIILLFVVGYGHANAQNLNYVEDEIDVCQKRVDSLLSCITDNMSDTSKAYIYHNIGVLADNMDTTIKYATLSNALCNENDYFTIGNNYYNIGTGYYMQDRSSLAIEYFLKSIEYFEKIDDKTKIGYNYIAIGRSYVDLNLQDSSLFYLSKALDVFSQLKDSTNISYVYQSLGIVNMNSGFYATAIDYFKKGILIDSLLGNYLDMAYSYHYLGNTCLFENNLDNAIVYLSKSSLVFDTIPTTDPYYVSARFSNYTELANAYISMAYKKNERAYADCCLACLEKIGSYFLDNANYSNQFSVQVCYARYYSFLGRNQDALKTLLDCEPYLLEDQRNLFMSEYYSVLSDVYKKLGDYKNALEASDKMHEYKVSAVNDSTMNVVAKFQAEQEVKIHTAEAEAKQSKLRLIIVALFSGLVLSFLLVFYIIKILNIKRKANEDLTFKNQMLDQQKSEIEAQRDEIEEGNRKLYSSIHYAQKIQSAAISPKSEVDALFPNNFVYYKPRDIVSGDFYYVVQCGKYSVLVTADCTGHGIPGAFLSMLGISALKEFCVTENDAANPGTILDRLRSFIKSTLVSDANRIIDDGMDMTICAFDFDNMELRYAAANQNAIVIRRGDAIKLKGDRMPVGRYILEKEHFTTETLPLEYGDVVYTFSDGIQDQPGGVDDNPLGKKFLVKNLIDFLTEHYDKPLERQCQLIDMRITAWRNGRPQVDDMTLIGVRV